MAIGIIGARSCRTISICIRRSCNRGNWGGCERRSAGPSASTPRHRRGPVIGISGQCGDHGAGRHGVSRQRVTSRAASSPNGDTDWIATPTRRWSRSRDGRASILFAVALLASGQSSTITGTLAGQVVMEGFMHWRWPWLRRLITRLVAIVPVILIIGVRGDARITDLLVLSQFMLALQLPFAMFPLLHFTSSRAADGAASARVILAHHRLALVHPHYVACCLRIAGGDRES